MPKDLVSNILTFRMAPNKQLNMGIPSPRQSTNNIDSIIINEKHVIIFANWIDRKLCYSYGDARSIGCCVHHGPMFGYSDRGKDFNFYMKTWYSDVNHCYPNVGIPKKFEADDYEVFQVIKN
ncbi:unnamed protein product [Rhizophagus irregularis]|nr:unnamed protein product [Rhizophagus irregularis]